MKTHGKEVSYGAINRKKNLMYYKEKKKFYEFFNFFNLIRKP